MDEMLKKVDKKDYWQKATREFRHISIFIVLVYGLSFFVWISNIKSFDITSNIYSIFISILSIVYLGGWFFLAHLFKTNNKKAIGFGYLMQAILAIYILVTAKEAVYFTPLLIPAYFTWVIYKASQYSQVNE